MLKTKIIRLLHHHLCTPLTAFLFMMSCSDVIIMKKNKQCMLIFGSIREK